RAPRLAVAARLQATTRPRFVARRPARRRPPLRRVRRARARRPRRARRRRRRTRTRARLTRTSPQTLGQPALEQHRVQVTVRVHRVGDVTRVDVFAGSDHLRDPARLGELAYRLGLGLGLPVLLAERHAARFEHARDEVVELEQRVAGIVAEALFEIAPLALPLVPVETWFLHETVVPRAGEARNPAVDSPRAGAPRRFGRARARARVATRAEPHALGA